MKVAKNTGNGILETFASLYCAIFRKPGSCKSLKFLVTSITFLDPETVELLAFYVLSTMFKAGVWPAREAKPRFGAVLECSVHDYESGS